MQKDLQRAQDLLNAMQAQRDQALNASVMASADNAELRRQIAALEEQVGKLRTELDKASPTEPETAQE